MPKPEFAQWVERAYVRWMDETGKHRSQREFAEFLGLRAANLNHYLSGRRLPTGESIHKLAKKLGPEVYDLLGVERPDAKEMALLTLFWQMDDVQKEDLLAYAATHLRPE